MTKITITDPSEKAPNGDGTWTGYWSVDIEEYGKLVASINVAGSELPDLDDPEDAAEFFEQAAENIRALDEMSDQFEDQEGAEDIPEDGMHPNSPQPGDDQGAE